MSIRGACGMVFAAAAVMTLGALPDGAHGRHRRHPRVEQLEAAVAASPSDLPSEPSSSRPTSMVGRPDSRGASSQKRRSRSGGSPRSSISPPRVLIEQGDAKGALALERSVLATCGDEPGAQSEHDGCDFLAHRIGHATRGHSARAGAAGGRRCHRAPRSEPCRVPQGNTRSAIGRRRNNTRGHSGADAWVVGRVVRLRNTHAARREYCRRWSLPAEPPHWPGRDGVGLAGDASWSRYPCAVKFIEGQMAALPEMQMRFEREAKAAAQLRSRTSCRFSITACARGRRTSRWSSWTAKISANASRRWATCPRPSCTTSLARCAGLSPRRTRSASSIANLKPDNIFLVRDDDREIAKVLDFGIGEEQDVRALREQHQDRAMLGHPIT